MSNEAEWEMEDEHQRHLDQLASQIKRSVIDSLLWSERADLAAILVDVPWQFRIDGANLEWDMYISVPVQHLSRFERGTDDAELVYGLVRQIATGHVFNSRGSTYNLHTLFVAQLLPPDADWEEVVKAQIAQGQATNQALVTEAAFRRIGKEPVMYGELKFGSKTEVRIAQELENRQITFFPLAVAVRAETGINHRDHREVDFLVVHEGVIGILEVSGPNHNGRQVNDVDKEGWFEKAGIACVKSYPAELCWSDPADVVTRFMGALALHKR